MKIKINDNIYSVEIMYKSNKNMYLRIKKGPKIVVTAPNNISEKQILKFIENNIKFIENNIKIQEKNETIKKGKFEYQGYLYDICYTNEKNIVLTLDRAFIGKDQNIDNWYRKQAKKVFSECYDKCFEIFKFSKEKPVLKIRKMTSKWGVCNITNKTITLNLELIKLDPKYLEYVIFHELCHLKEPNHSERFWSHVQQYVPDYKQIKKEMKNI